MNDWKGHFVIDKAKLYQTGEPSHSFRAISYTVPRFFLAELPWLLLVHLFLIVGPWRKYGCIPLRCFCLFAVYYWNLRYECVRQGWLAKPEELLGAFVLSLLSLPPCLSFTFPPYFVKTLPCFQNRKWKKAHVAHIFHFFYVCNLQKKKTLFKVREYYRPFYDNKILVWIFLRFINSFCRKRTHCKI